MKIKNTFLLFIVAVLGAALAAAAFYPLSTSFCASGALSDRSVALHRGLSVEQVRQLHTQRGLTNDAICAMPQDKLERALMRANNPKPDHPDDAVAFRLLQWQDENGDIPPDGIARGQEHAKSMPTGNLVPGGEPLDLMGQSLASPDPALQGVPAQASLTGANLAGWTWLGPGNIGGRVRSIVIHPTTTTRMWAGSVSGGIWYTSDGGASWSSVDDFMANLAVSTLVMDPMNSNTMYAGTGEGFYNADGIRGAGVFKSTDGGVTWTQLAATAATDWYYVNRLAISPNGATLLAAVRSGIWRSTDGGGSWTKVSGVITDWTDIDFHPTDSNKAVAGGYNGKAYYSTNGGQTWTAGTGFTAGSDRVELAYAPSSPTTVYASVDYSNGQLWKSTNGGSSYTLSNTGNSYLGGQGWYDNVVWVAPNDPNLVVVGGIDLWRSTNGGSTLTRISDWWLSPSSAHADHHAIVNHPGYNGSTNKTVFFGNDGGVYKAADVSTVKAGSPPNGWQELNNQLGITQYYGAAGNVSSGVIVGGTQDNGTLRYSGSTEGWTDMYGGDGGFCAADQTNPNYFYGEYVYLNIHRSTNAGVSADNISGEYWNGSAWVWKSAPYYIPDAKNYTANFIAPFVLDPNNSNRLLGGGLSLWRTNDVKTANTNTTGPSWASIKSSIGSNISAIAIAQGNSDLIWVGHNNGNVYKTTNGTVASPTWTQVDNNPTALPNRYVSRITIDPNNTNIVYVTFTGFSAGNVWRTTDGGSTWNNISGTGATALPSVPVRSLVIHPDNANWLYVGTEIGIFNSSDAGANWISPHIGPANVSVDELFWMDHKLTAATHGRGLYQVDLNQSVLATGAWTGDAGWNPKTVFNPGDGIVWVITVQNNTGTDATVQLTYDVRGPLNQSLAYWQGDVTTPAGTVNWGLSGSVADVRGQHTFTGSADYGGSTTQAVATYDVPADVLLVDDDDNVPDVRAYYTDALTALGVSYEVWDTGNTDTTEPGTAKLGQYPAVVWFTGDEYGGAAGPSAASETALGSWLDNNAGCLLISSQDYYYDKGLTTFMQNYLGVASATSDQAQTSVTGQGTVFGGLGAFTLSYPFNNYSDIIAPAASPAELAFMGDKGQAAVDKFSGVYRTTFWGFPFEALPAATDRQNAMSKFLQWCGVLNKYEVFIPFTVHPSATTNTQP
ncbi:MAG: hypothetical protein AB1894_17600 [Chloroflexota bacterium]